MCSFALVGFSLCFPRLFFVAHDWLRQWDIPLPECLPMPGAIDAWTTLIYAAPCKVRPLTVTIFPGWGHARLVCNLGEVAKLKKTVAKIRFDLGVDPNSPWVGALPCYTLLLKIGWDWLTLTSWCVNTRSRYCLEMQAGAVPSPCQVLIQVSLRCQHCPPSSLLVQPRRNVLAELCGPVHHRNSICPKPLPPFSESSPSHFS